MQISKIFDGATELAHVYDLRAVSKSEFPTPNSFPMQFGVGVTKHGCKFSPHVHKTAKREIDATAEFIFVMSGKMTVTFLGVGGSVVETVEILPNMCFLQVAGGHALSTDDETKYFEIKQGPYFGREFDKYDVQI